MKKLRTILHFILLTTVCLNGYAQSRGYTVQMASMPTEAEAQAEMAKLAAAGLPAHIVKANVRGKGIWYRVRFGRFNTLVEAQLSAEQALKRGLIKEFIVTLYETPTASATARHDPKTPEEKPAEEKKLAAEKTSATPQPRSRQRRAEEKDVSTNEKETANQNQPKTAVGKQAAAPSQSAKSNELAPSAEAKPSAASSSILSKPPEATHRPVTKPETTVAPTAETASGKVLVNTKAEDPEKISPEPRIAQPPIAEALGELDITNRNWKVVRRSTATDKNLRAVYFVDSMTGWAAGDLGAAYRTTDGGKTWKPLLSGAAANVNQIHFVDWNHGWMLGEMLRKEDAEPETVLLSTTNGGRSWQKKPLPQVLSIYFTDAQHGWAVGKNATVLRTEDGGTQWKPYGDLEKLIGLPVESSNYNFGFRDIFFLNAQYGWLIGNFLGREKSHIGGLFITSDGGATWKRLPMTVQTKYTSGRFTPGVLHSVHFTDPNTGTVTGEMLDGEGRFFFALHTRDGGKSWEQYRTPSRAAHSTQFLDAAQGWTAAAAPREGGADAVVYDTTLMRTDNGGASWRYDFIARGSRIRGVFFLSPSRGWAVGDRGMILRYEEKTKTN